MLTSTVSYTAASILLAAALRSDNTVDLDANPYNDYGQRAIQILNHNKV
jgi:hypothetical protein